MSTRSVFRRLGAGLVFAVLIFALVGPLVGGAAMVGFIWVMERRFEPLTREMLQIIVWFSYLFGGAQALLAGMGTAMLALRRGGTSFWHPVLVVIGLHAALALLLVAAGLFSGRTSGPPMPFIALASPALSLIAATICWLAARPLLKGA